MKKFLAVLAVMTLLVGCSKVSVRTDQQYDEFKQPNHIVSVDYLIENKEEVIILDARGTDAHAKGHIPNALPVAWQMMSDMNHSLGEQGWGNILDAKALSEVIANLGITKDSEVIVYADTLNGWGEDGRIVWTLTQAGIDAKMLDGGFNAWSVNGHEVSKEEVTTTKSDFTLESLNKDNSILTAELKDNYDNYVVIDTRDIKEYEGAQKYGEARGGHLPNAIHVDFKQFLKADGTLESAETIEAVLSEAGIKKSDKLVTYCTAGIRSGHEQVILSMLGYDAKNYEDGFYYWAALEGTEIVEK